MKSRKLFEEIAGSSSEEEVLITVGALTYEIKNLEYITRNGKKTLVLVAGKPVDLEGEQT